MAAGLLIYSHCHLIRVSNPDQQAPEAIGLMIDQATKTHKWISQHTLESWNLHYQVCKVNWRDWDQVWGRV